MRAVATDGTVLDETITVRFRNPDPPDELRAPREPEVEEPSRGSHPW